MPEDGEGASARDARPAARRSARVTADGRIDKELVRQLEALPGVKRVKPLRF